ncbi:MAG: YcaO-like family protein [Actinomycetota bacterium]|nr:YcaO-like family protein [Actinomycetota bacterium]
MSVGKLLAPPSLAGAVLDAPKRRLEGAQRASDPAELLARLAGPLAKSGVTRLCNLTGLDRLGIPVAAAIRPNSSWYACDAGKGVTVEAALVSAAMEAIERARLESVRPAGVRASYAALARDGLVAELSAYPAASAAIFHPEVEAEWHLAPLLGGGSLALPYEMVGAMAPRAGGDGCLYGFQAGSNGLSAGSVLAEAVLAGLYEVIERDALACWEAAAGAGRRRLALGEVLGDLADPWPGMLVERCHAAGVVPLVFECTSDVAVPTYACFLAGDGQDGASAHAGYGAHLDPAVALVRAITEAAQSRAVLFAAARDDQFWSAFRHHRRVTGGQGIAALCSEEATVHELPDDSSGASFGADLARVLLALDGVGCPDVAVVELGGEGEFPAVVRVVVPGLEGYPHIESYAVGRRAGAAAGRR